MHSFAQCIHAFIILQWENISSSCTCIVYIYIYKFICIQAYIHMHRTYIYKYDCIHLHSVFIILQWENINSSMHMHWIYRYTYASFTQCIHRYRDTYIENIFHSFSDGAPWCLRGLLLVVPSSVRDKSPKVNYFMQILMQYFICGFFFLHNQGYTQYAERVAKAVSDSFLDFPRILKFIKFV